jgi:hypothetical protein
MPQTEAGRVAILSVAAERAIDALSVPAAEYVPAIGDAIRILTDGLTDADMADFSCGPWTLKKRRAFMRLSVEDRRVYMEEQAERALLSAPYLGKWEG